MSFCSHHSSLWFYSSIVAKQIFILAICQFYMELVHYRFNPCRLLLGMTVRNRTETDEVLLTIDCNCMNQRRHVPNIIGWSALSFDISDCDGQVVIIGQDEEMPEKKLQKSKCTACVLEEFKIELNDDDCYFPIYIISRSDAVHLRAIMSNGIKLDIRIRDTDVVPVGSIQSRYNDFISKP